MLFSVRGANLCDYLFPSCLPPPHSQPWDFAPPATCQRVKMPLTLGELLGAAERKETVGAD